MVAASISRAMHLTTPLKRFRISRWKVTECAVDPSLIKHQKVVPAGATLQGPLPTSWYLTQQDYRLYRKDGCSFWI